MAKTLFISVVIFSKLIVNSILEGNSPSVGQPCNKVNEIIADEEGCEIYFICNIDKTWSRESCSFPWLFSETEKRCEHFINVSCGERCEPRSPCMYTGESKALCSYIPQHTICQCVNTMDLNFDMCVGLSDGLYAWPSRKLSKYYIQCLVGRTLPMECEGSSMVFDFQERHCSLLYDEISRVYNHTVPLAESMLVPVPPPNVDVTRTQLIQERSLPLQLPSSAFVFDSLTLSAGWNSTGKQVFLPPFSQLIHAILTDGDVTQTNLFPDRFLLFQQPSSVFVTNTLKSKCEEKSLTVRLSSVAVSVPAIRVDMRQTQFVPEKYSLLHLTDSTIIMQPSLTLAFDVFKSTSEFYPTDVELLSSYNKNPLTTKHMPASTVETLFPAANILISQSTVFRSASLSTSIYMQNLYSTDRVRTTPNRMIKALTSATTITSSAENSPGINYLFIDSSTWIVDSENSADFSSYEAINTPLIDQTLESISSGFLEINVINYGTYLSAGLTFEAEIIFPSDYVRNATANFDITISKSYQLSYTSTNGSLSAANKSTDFTATHSSVIGDNTFILTMNAFLTPETDLDRLSRRFKNQMHAFSSESTTNSGISRPNNPGLVMPSDLTDIETGFPASKAEYQHGLSNMIFFRPSDTEIKVSSHFRSNHLSHLPQSSTQNIFSISINTSTIITSFIIFTSQLNSLPSAILESTLLTTDGQSSISREVSDKGLSVLPMKATNDENMQSKMAPSFHSKIVYGGISSLDQFGYPSLKSSPKLEHPKITFSTMDSMDQFISTISTTIKITDSIQPTKAEPVSKSAQITVSMKPTEELKPKLTTVDSNMASSEPNIFPKKLALLRSPSTPPMLKISELMASEMILKSSFIPVILMNFQTLLLESGTPAIDTYSLLTISESLHSTKRLQYASSQAITIEAGGPSVGLALKSSPGSMPLIYDSQLSPSRMLEIASPSQAITWSATSIMSTSNSLIQISKANASSLTSATNIISSSVPDTSNSQSTESTKSKQNDNYTKSITSTKYEESNPFNLTNTSFIAVMLWSCAGFVLFVPLTTMLIIYLRKRTNRKQELQIG